MSLNFTRSARGIQSFLFLAALCLLANLQSAKAQVCASANNIFGMDASGNIYPVDVTTGTVGTKINTTAFNPAANQANAIGYDIGNSSFYYFQINPGAGSQKFISYNTVTGKYSNLAKSPTSATVHAGCVNFSGTGYYCSDVNGSLYYYNIAADKWITITSDIVDNLGNDVTSVITTQNSGDMAIDGFNNLWMITSSSSNYALYKIPAASLTAAHATVTATQVIAPATKTPLGSAFEGIAFNSSGQIFMTSSDGKMYKLNTASTALVSMGTLSNSAVANDLASCSYPFTILPISWVSFAVSLNSSNDISVNWSVEDAAEVKGFYVERSNDNQTWQQLNYVEFKQDEANYAYVDANPLSGNNYYRIHEVEYDNNENYSAIRMISISSAIKFAVWPNPARDVVNIQNNSANNNMHAQVFDEFGRMVSGTTIHQGINSMNIASLPAGTYIMHMTGTNGVAYNEKIIKR